MKVRGLFERLVLGSFLFLCHCTDVMLPGTPESLPVYSPQNIYYSQVFSIGPKVDRNGDILSESGYAAFQCESGNHCVRVEWTTPQVPDFEGQVEYAIYRRPKGSSDFNNKIATVSENYFIDTDPSLILGQSYLYQVAIVLDGREYRGESVLPEIEIIKPQANLSFVHRWMVNLDVCSQMGRGAGQAQGVELAENYRCPFNGFGGELIDGKAYYDFGKHLLVDRFENSCVYSQGQCSAHDPGDASSTTDCYGTADPGAAGITGSLNSVYYRRGTRHCYINTDGAGTWQSFSSSSVSQQIAMTGNLAKEPAFTRLSQTQSAAFCNGRSVQIDGVSQAMKLSSRRDFMAYSSWDASMNDSEITDLEAGLNVSGNCNTDSGHGLTWDDSYPPTNIDFLAGTSGNGFFVAGSEETNNCVSRYGVQDLVGNAYEWISDEIDSNVGVTSTLDPSNDWLEGLVFNGQVAPLDVFAEDFDSFTYLNIPLGIPLNCTVVAPEDPSPACQSDDLLVPITSDNFHGDKFWLHNSNNRGGLVGGLWADGTSAGRYRFAFDQNQTVIFSGAGVRCVSEVTQ